jgi:dihydrofolate reductase
METSMKIILIMALTADGKIGRTSDHFPDWTEPEDKKLFMSVSRDAGVLIMGSKTFDTLAKPLPGRKHVVMTRDDTRRSSDENLVFTGKSPGEVLHFLAAEGYETAVLAGGAQINHLFAKEKLIDEILLTYSPKIFGAGLSIFPEPVHMELELLEYRRIGENTLMARYRVIKD